MEDLGVAGRWGLLQGEWSCDPVLGPHDNLFHLDEPHNGWYKLQLSAMLSGNRKRQGLLHASSEISVQSNVMINGEQRLFFLLLVHYLLTVEFL